MQLPIDFITLMRQSMGETEAEALFHSLEAPSPVSVRMNPSKLAQPYWPDVTQVPWCEYGYYLPQRPQFTLDPLFHAGCYYVQEASSMFCYFALHEVINRLREQVQDDTPSKKEKPIIALDLCAAPGGKTTAALSLLPSNSLLIANEMIGSRAEVLKGNMQRWGSPNIKVTQEAPSAFSSLHNCFDIIIADVPCSGEGMFRKEPIALQQWSKHYVEEMATLQRQIVTDVWPSLRSGGYLIYSTCTYNSIENEQNVQHFLKDFDAESVELFPDASWNLLPAYSLALSSHFPTTHAYHLLPSRVRGEGFFLSVLRKQEGEGSNVRRKQPWDKLRTIYNAAEDAHTVYPQIELNLIDARCYLRGETLSFSPDTPRGLIQVCYQSHPLGLMKNIGTRANNLYPKNLRIRTTYID